MPQVLHHFNSMSVIILPLKFIPYLRAVSTILLISGDPEGGVEYKGPGLVTHLPSNPQIPRGTNNQHFTLIGPN